MRQERKWKTDWGWSDSFLFVFVLSLRRSGVQLVLRTVFSFIDILLRAWRASSQRTVEQLSGNLRVAKRSLVD